MLTANDNSNYVLRKNAKTNKITYRNILDISHSFKWPRIQTELSKRILDNLLKVLEPVGQYRQSLSSKIEAKSLATKPTILTEMQLIYGINSVTRYLEKTIQHQRQYTNKMEICKDNDKDLIPVLFVCRRDIKPLQLCTHLLTMSALAGIKLVPLPLDTEKTLSKVLYLPKTSCLLVKLSSKSMSIEEESLSVCLHEVSLVQTSWLTNPHYQHIIIMLVLKY
ncbi:unnamed protein product [Cunninghamella blakesleeana]